MLEYKNGEQGKESLFFNECFDFIDEMDFGLVINFGK